MITQNEFIKMASWTKKTWELFFIKKTVDLGEIGAIKYMLRLRYSFQKQLSVYSKTNKFDRLQHNAVRQLELSMKMCKAFYAPGAAEEVIKNDFSLATRPRKVKSIVNGEWEKLVKRSSY